MLIDSVTITAKAGKGGNGAASFSKIVKTLGPTGASGGKGGDVYIEAVADIGALRHFRAQKVFVAENGRDGRSAFRDGHRGSDLILQIPRGTLVTNVDTGVEYEPTKLGERMLIAKGGRGGKGNFHYRSPTNTSPKQFQVGLPGEEFKFRLELRLIADIGLVGLPNVGKSSFLNAVTKAKSPVANYAFTTLEPHLGAYYELILADIPGLIEGSSSGKGLGIRFLRHIERTRILFHFIDATSEDPLSDYKTIRKELGAYNPELLEKEEYIFVSKSDEVDETKLKKIIKTLVSTKREIFPISILNEEQMKEAKKLLNRIQEEQKK